MRLHQDAALQLKIQLLTNLFSSSRKHLYETANNGILFLFKARNRETSSEVTVLAT